MLRPKQTIVTLLFVGTFATLSTVGVFAAPYGSGGYGECQYQNNCSSAAPGGSSNSGGNSKPRSTTPLSTDHTDNDTTGASSEEPSDAIDTASPTSPTNTKQPRKFAKLQEHNETSFYKRNKHIILWLSGVGGLLLFALLLFVVKRRYRAPRQFF